MSTRDLVWLVTVIALLSALAIDRYRHRSEMDRLDAEARGTIHGLAGELWRCRGTTVLPSEFAPRTPLPARYDWKQAGSILPEWAEEPLGAGPVAPPRTGSPEPTPSGR